MPILGHVAARAHASADVRLELVQGTIREAGALLKRDWIPDGWFSVATFQEPDWRIEGKKTLGLELAEEAGETLAYGLNVPGGEVVVFNTGSLEKYLPELRHLLVDSL